jgi:hypothetical protein
MSSLRFETNAAMAVKCGWVSPDTAMKVTWWRQTASMSRLEMRISRRAGFIILEPGIEACEVKLVVNQVVECVLEGAGKELPLEINRQKTRAGVDVFVAGHTVGASQNQ